MVFGGGADASGWDEFSKKDDGYKVWEVEPPEPTVQFDIQPGTFEDLLAAGVEGHCQATLRTWGVRPCSRVRMAGSI